MCSEVFLLSKNTEVYKNGYITSQKERKKQNLATWLQDPHQSNVHLSCPGCVCKRSENTKPRFTCAPMGEIELPKHCRY